MCDMEITRKILSYIEKNLAKELTLEKIAKEFNYSRFYLARTFKADTGCTLHKYIRGRRLDEAAAKLAKTGEPIVEIAYEAGYSSQQAFTQAFHNEYFCTPQEYRRIGVFIPKQDKLEAGCGNNSVMSAGGKSPIFLLVFAKGRIAA